MQTIIRVICQRDLLDLRLEKVIEGLPKLESATGSIQHALIRLTAK